MTPFEDEQREFPPSEAQGELNVKKETHNKEYFILITVVIAVIILAVVLPLLGGGQGEDIRVPVNELVIDEAVPLTGMQETYELTGEYGCLISYPLTDGEEKSRLSYFSTDYFPEVDIAQFFDYIAVWHELLSVPPERVR